MAAYIAGAVLLVGALLVKGARGGATGMGIGAIVAAVAGVAAIVLKALGVLGG